MCPEVKDDDLGGGGCDNFEEEKVGASMVVIFVCFSGY